MEQKKINFELDTTVFKNIHDEKFVFHLNNQPIEVDALSEKILPVYVAQHGAKHLIDLILQKKFDIKDTLRDTPLRKDLYAQILPQLAEVADVKPMSQDEFQQNVFDTLAKQNAKLAELSGTKDDSRVAQLEALVKQLLAEKETAKEQKVAKKTK